MCWTTCSLTLDHEGETGRAFPICHVLTVRWKGHHHEAPQGEDPEIEARPHIENKSAPGSSTRGTGPRENSEHEFERKLSCIHRLHYFGTPPLTCGSVGGFGDGFSGGVQHATRQCISTRKKDTPRTTSLYLSDDVTQDLSLGNALDPSQRLQRGGAGWVGWAGEGLGGVGQGK